MISEFSYPEQEKKFKKFIAENPVNFIWRDGCVMRVYTGIDIPKPELYDVSDLQIRLALNKSGLRDGVELYVSQADQDTKDWWDRATKFERNNPMVLSAAAALGVTDAQLDNLWLLAATL